jgi:hypothetical protein
MNENPWDLDVNRALIGDVNAMSAAQLRLEVLSLRDLALNLRDALELAIGDNPPQQKGACASKRQKATRPASKRLGAR